MSQFIIERIYIVSVETSNLMNAIADKQCRQKDVAKMYADLIIADNRARKCKSNLADWVKVNNAIAERWPKGLNRVKEMAWRELECER